MVTTRQQRAAQEGRPAGGSSPAPPTPSKRRGSTGGSKASSRGSGWRGGRTQVFLYYPNLVGYLRVLFTLASFAFGVRGEWEWCVSSYFLGFFGDLVDGYLARRFNQSSEFGAVLDMVTDRTSTAGLVMLNLFWTPGKNTARGQAWGLFWMLLVVIDIGSHWFHCISTAKHGHHKAADTLAGRTWLLRVYYGVFWFFAFCCVGQEAFYLINFTSYFAPPGLLLLPLGSTLTGYVVDHQRHCPWLLLAPAWDRSQLGIDILAVLWCVSLVACVIKQLVNVAQLLSAACTLADGDAAKRKN